MTLVRNIGVHSYTYGIASISAPTFATVRLHCMAMMESAWQRLHLRSSVSSVGRHTCGWSAMRVQGAVRRLQQRRRCIRCLAVVGQPPFHLNFPLHSHSPNRRYQMRRAALQPRVQAILRVKQTRYRDSTCLIMLPLSAVPLAVELKLSRRPATPIQIDVRPCDPSAIPLHTTSTGRFFYHVPEPSFRFPQSHRRP